MTLTEWAYKWHIPHQAFQELCASALCIGEADGDRSEAYVQSQVRLEAAEKNKYLYRNNRGAGKMDSGSFVRFGLANDSKKIGDAFKSGDLIGWEPVFITPELVGCTVARFLSVEVKRTDWRFSGSLEDMAQISWATLVNVNGGRAVIVNGPGYL